jgi:formylglycine-generating enzyme required for sulfatase activity
MPWHPSLNRLRDALAELYPHAKAMRRVADSAALPLDRVALQDEAVNDWQAILEEAVRQDAVDDLIEVVVAEYPRKRPLLMAVEAYRQRNLKPKASPPAPAATQAPSLASSPARVPSPVAAVSAPAGPLHLGAGLALDLVRVPEGEFLMGSTEADPAATDCEKPYHRLWLPEYLIAKYPVTVAQFRAFVRAAGHPIGQPEAIQGPDDHPAAWVSWPEAVAFCAWASSLSGREVRLPSEAEWEKAARGTDGRIYPWGQRWDPARCNSEEKGPGHTTPVGQYGPLGDSPYGCADMAGNVWEWTRSLWGRDASEPEFGYAYDPADGREDPDAGAGVLRVVRGGAFDSSESFLRCALRDCFNPLDHDPSNGFRVVA